MSKTPLSICQFTISVITLLSRSNAVVNPRILSACKLARKASAIIAIIYCIPIFSLGTYIFLRNLCAKVVYYSSYSSLNFELEDWVKQEGVNVKSVAKDIKSAFMYCSIQLVLDNRKLTNIPDAIGKLTNLQSLYLRHNNLTNIPDTIGKLTNLRGLYLAHNNLTSIPDISNLTQLTSLNISNNPNLTDLHLSLAECTNLQYIDFSGTQIPQNKVNAILDICKKKRNLI